jgi:hypothetical protein
MSARSRARSIKLSGVEAFPSPFATKAVARAKEKPRATARTRPEKSLALKAPCQTGGQLLSERRSRNWLKTKNPLLFGRDVWRGWETP